GKGGKADVLVLYSSRSRHTIFSRDWSSDVCSSDLGVVLVRSIDGRVTAFDADDGSRMWFWQRETPALSVRGSGSPLLGPGLVFRSEERRVGKEWRWRVLQSK